jgi:hypothetical protein
MVITKKPEEDNKEIKKEKNNFEDEMKEKRNNY